MLSDYILSVVTFRVIARDSMSPSFQSFLSGPPFFSSACTPQRGLALSTSRLLCAFLPAFCPQVEPSCKLWAAQGCGCRWVCWFLHLHTPSTAGAPAAGQAPGWQPAQVPACPQESMGQWGRLVLSLFIQICTHSLL